MDISSDEDRAAASGARFDRRREADRAARSWLSAFLIEGLVHCAFAYGFQSPGLLDCVDQGGTSR